jgi:ankyrin repeat protein
MGQVEDNYDMEMKHLHRVVVGLGGMSLQNALELDASSINNPDGTGMTPLMWASARSDDQSTRLLLSSGADCDAADTERTTALHFAAMEGSQACITAILDAGGDVNAADVHGYTPLHFAVQNAASETVIKLLIEAGASLNARTKYGWTPLFLSVNNNLPTVLSILVKFGDDINALDDRSSPPIARAIALSHCDVLRVLCKERARFSWNGKGGNGSNIIKEAARFASVEAMNILAETDNEFIPYDASEVYRYFNGREHLMPPANDSGSPEALAAFGNLLAKRGRPEIASSHIPPHVSVSESLSTGAGQDEDEYEESDVFEDALETVPSI